jgi:hypothetical protein
VVVRDFDIGWSLGFPFEADSILIVDPDAELAFPIANQGFHSVPAERSQIFQGCRGVKPDQTSSSLHFDIHQFNDALAAHQLLCPLVNERLNHYLDGTTLKEVS